MKAVQVPKPGADFQIVERELPKPQRRQVRIKVEACPHIADRLAYGGVGHHFCVFVRGGVRRYLAGL